MISFIVIGKNEELNIRRCIESIIETIRFNKIDKFEIIYVDSQSKDSSLSIAQSFSDVRCFVVTGTCNAAIARNVGAAEAVGDLFFFVDGDMELKPEFLKRVLIRGELISDVVSGQLCDIIDGRSIHRICGSFLGGVFIIKKSIWSSVKGMRTSFSTGEDLDLGLRLNKKNIQVYRSNDFIANHYTKYILDQRGFWQRLKNKYTFCSRSVLYRTHLFNFFMYKKLWESDKTFIYLILNILVFPFNIMAGLFGVLGYLFLILIRFKRNFDSYKIDSFYLNFIISDFLCLIYFFIFFPSPKDIQYKKAF